MNASSLHIHIPRYAPAPEDILMNGSNPSGRVIAANRRYLTFEGQPWLPVMGEFHFSRFPKDRWEEELLKMKAGGIDIIATYIFWIHIEEIEGTFDWSANRDLRAFVALCGRLGLYAYPRIGPWAHGECRNGGFPDWLLEKCGALVRQDAPEYLSHVKRFYEAVAGQLHGLLWKDGGPVIGIQIENELYDNAQHLHTLKNMAVTAGIQVPLYTMTGWGPAEVPQDALIPVFGGYPDAFWDRDITGWSRASRKHYFFTRLRDDNTIGADLRTRPDLSSTGDMDRYPYGTCETGGGMQVSYHRRPIIAAQDIAALAFTKIGNGSNLLGYYMYHGGSNPSGGLTTLQESQITGYPNDLPVINYDFQAPIGQYGQVRASFFALRPLHLFLHDFGSRLASLPVHLPEVQPSNLDDTSTLRWAVRGDGERGFLFINNYQRIDILPDHDAVQFQIHLPGKEMLLPSRPARIPSGFTGIWPIRLDLSGATLLYATAQPLCVLQEENSPLFVFFAHDDVPAEFAFDRSSVARVNAAASITLDEHAWVVQKLMPGTSCVITLTTNTGATLRVLLLTQAQARACSKLQLWGAERLLVSAAPLYTDGIKLHLPVTGTGSDQDVNIDFSVFPAPPSLGLDSPLEAATSGADPLTMEKNGVFSRFTLRQPAPAFVVQANLTQPALPAAPVRIGPAGVAQAPEDDAFEGAEKWSVTLTEAALQGASEIFLTVDYVGDVARAYIQGRLIDDDFYHGQPWQIGLSRFLPDALLHGIELRILPLRRDAPIYLPSQAVPTFDDMDQAVAVRAITLEIIHEVIITSV